MCVCPKKKDKKTLALGKWEIMWFTVSGAKPKNLKNRLATPALPLSA